MLFKSSGILDCRQFDEYFGIYLNVSQSISNYYYNLIPKFKKKSQQRYASHITVVRIYKEFPKNIHLFDSYKNQSFNFYYSNIIRENENYYWLDVYSKELENLRTVFGLKNEYYFSDEKHSLIFNKTFHITIGNKK